MTPERERANAVGPSFFLGFKRHSLLVDDRIIVHPTFKALLQGDAGGVEFAIIDDFFVWAFRPALSVRALSVIRERHEGQSLL